jgi:hypothetical protein
MRWIQRPVLITSIVLLPATIMAQDFVGIAVQNIVRARKDRGFPAPLTA